MSQCRCQCSDCGREFDIQATLKEREEGLSDKFVCPGCRSTNIRSKFSLVNFIKNIFCGDKACCCSGGDGCCETDKKDLDDNKKICCSDKTACCGEEKGPSGKDDGCRCA